MKWIKILTLFIIFGIIHISCTINNHEVDGQADLVYSSTILIDETDFTAEDDFISIAEYGWDNLDEYVVDQGLVLGYLQFEGTTSWHALPFTVPFENDVVILRYNFDIESFNLILEGEIAGNNNANEALFDGDILRVIAIPPTQIVRSKGFDYKNYEAVADYYGLDK